MFLLLQDKVRDPFKGPVALPHTFGQETIILFVLEVRTIMQAYNNAQSGALVYTEFMS